MGKKTIKTMDGVGYQERRTMGLGGARNNTRTKEFIITNMWARKISDLCMSRFVWHGLPESVDARFLERTIFTDGVAVYFRHELGADMVLPAAPSSQLDVYDNPLEFRVVGNQWVNKTIPATECVPIWTNYMRVPDLDIVNIYAARLAQFDLSLDSLIVTTRHPVIMIGEESMRASLQAAFRQVADGQPVLLGYDSFGQTLQDKIMPFDMGISVDEIAGVQVAKTRVWNECMNLLGINAANQDKRERLVADEVAANDDIVSMCRGSALDARRAACRQIGAKFGVPVEVEWRPSEITHDTTPATVDGGTESSEKSHENWSQNV